MEKIIFSFSDIFVIKYLLYTQNFHRKTDFFKNNYSELIFHKKKYFLFTHEKNYSSFHVNKIILQYGFPYVRYKNSKVIIHILYILLDWSHCLPNNPHNKHYHNEYSIQRRNRNFATQNPPIELSTFIYSHTITSDFHTLDSKMRLLNTRFSPFRGISE